jgi:hypothetical protein
MKMKSLQKTRKYFHLLEKLEMMFAAKVTTPLKRISVNKFQKETTNFGCEFM